MYKPIIGALVAILAASGTVSAQHGGHGGGGHGGGGHAGGGHAGGGHYGGGHYGGGYGGYRGGYGLGGYGLGGYGLGGYGFGGYGLGYPGYGGYGLGGLGGYGSRFGGYGSGGYYGNYSSGYSPSYYVPYSSGYSSVPGGTYVNPQLDQYPSQGIEGLPSALNTPSVPASATLTVVAPSGGQVWFDGAPGQNTPSGWVYTSPALEPGRAYTVTVKARWVEGGQDRSCEMPMQLAAGGNSKVDLSTIR